MNRWLRISNLFNAMSVLQVIFAAVLQVCLARASLQDDQDGFFLSLRPGTSSSEQGIKVSIEPRDNVKKMLQVGLGCDTGDGPGASASLWRNYFTDASEIWFAEYNVTCVNAHLPKLKAEPGVHVVAGDQSDPFTLKRWLNETGGNFDVIVDEGHVRTRICGSFPFLFRKALKPGGVYVYHADPVVQEDSNPVIDALSNWLQYMGLKRGSKLSKCGNGWRTRKNIFMPFEIPGMSKSVECSYGICAVTKCLVEESHCKPLGSQ